LCPELSFETFLDRYALVANFDEDNLKHPADAIKKLLPKKSAQSTSDTVTFNPDEVRDLMMVYIEMIREAELANTPIKLSFARFLSLPKIREASKNGDFTTKKEEKPKKSQQQKLPLTIAPTEVGQRCVLTTESARQHRGTLAAVSTEHKVADFKADSGELFTSVMLSSLQASNDAMRRGVKNSQGEQLSVLQQGKLTIPKIEYERIAQVQATKQMLGTVPEHSPAYSYLYSFGEYSALIEVVNAAPIYIDARLVMTADTSDSVFEIAPRDNILGSYEFVTDAGIYYLNVVCPRAAEVEALPAVIYQK